MKTILLTVLKLLDAIYFEQPMYWDNQLNLQYSEWKLPQIEIIILSNKPHLIKHEVFPLLQSHLKETSTADWTTKISRKHEYNINIKKDTDAPIKFNNTKGKMFFVLLNVKFLHNVILNNQWFYRVVVTHFIFFHPNLIFKFLTLIGYVWFTSVHFPFVDQILNDNHSLWSIFIAGFALCFIIKIITMLVIIIIIFFFFSYFIRIANFLNMFKNMTWALDE